MMSLSRCAGYPLGAVALAAVLGAFGCSKSPSSEGKAAAGLEALRSSAIVYTYGPDKQEEALLPQEGKAGGSAAMAEDAAEVYLMPAEDAPLRASDLTPVVDELNAMREEIARLDQSITTVMNTRLSGLEEENRNLRRELQRMYALRGTDADYVPPQVPAPGRDLLTEIRASAQPETSPDDKETVRNLPPVTATTAGTSGAVRYTIIKEWGRSPEEAATLGPDVSTLRGMICAIPKDTSEEALISLGKSLREQYDPYSNINIEVFNDVDAARRYVDENASPGVSRVLAISKHAESGQDAIVLFKDGAATEIPH